MKKLQLSTTIQAPREVVWNTMFAPETYKLWTADFCEGSYFEGSWDEGGRIRFLAPGGSGVSSVIAANRPYEFMSIKHLGMIKDGVEDTESEEVRSWAPSFEDYSFAAAGSGTELTIMMDVTPDFEEYMAKIWPKALERLKTLCETDSPAPK